MLSGTMPPTRKGGGRNRLMRGHRPGPSHACRRIRHPGSARAQGKLQTRRLARSSAARLPRSSRETNDQRRRGPASLHARQP